MTRRFLFALSLATGVARGQAASSALTGRLDSTAAAALAAWPGVGLSVAVVRGRDTLLLKGYGRADLENDVPATPATVYRIGSITKQFTAAAIMQLVEQGKIALDDTIQRFLPEYHAQGHHVTVRELLTHTSGIKSYTSLGPAWTRTITLDLSHDSLVALFQDVPFDFEPGTRFLYDNSGFYLLGMIIERVSGEPYADYLAHHLFEPLGLRATRYCDARPLIPHRARGYERDSAGFVNASPLSMTQPFSAGALCSTVGDLVAWTRALDAGRPVTAASYAAMTTPATLADGSHTAYGFGLAIGELGGHRKVAHGGGINGFLTELDDYPADSLTIVVLTNSESTRPGRLADDLARLVLAVPAPVVKDLPIASGDAARVVGTYAMGPLQIRVFQSGATLMAQATGQPAFRLRAQGGGTFVASFDDQVTLEFRPAGARATAFVLTQGGVAQTATRVE
jgi:D-alanyl-D-alanine carboxypeptidase